MPKTTIAAILVGLVLTPLLSAQPQWPKPDDEWEFSFFGGLSVGDTKFTTVLAENEETPQSVGLDYASGLLAGMRITQNLGDHAAAELEYTYANSPMAFIDVKPGLNRLDLDHGTHSVIYSILYYPVPRSQRIRPFLSAGVGAAFYRVTSASKSDAIASGVSLTDRWKFAVSLGGGVKYKLSSNWGFRLDVRDQLTGVPDYGLPSVAQVLQGSLGPAFRADGQLHNWRLSCGISYYFAGF
jgi:opacity protein-like surface antigen